MAQPFPRQRSRQLQVSHGAFGSILNPGHLHLPSTTDLPAVFPQVETPRFHDGDRLCWTTQNDPTDWGIVIGRFYSFAPHRCHWHWCYLIWLDSGSPSATWVKADIAWEDDLEPLD